MSKQNKITLGLSAALLMASAGQVMAAQTVTSTATATVQNAFTLTENTPIDFGTIRATADPAGTATSTLVIAANAATAPVASSSAPSALTVITAGAPGSYSISGAAAFTSLTLTLPTTATLTAAAAPPGTPAFTAGTWTAYITSGPNASTAYAAANLQTDVNGAVDFTVGATLTTDATVTTSPYIDGAYTGSYDIVVSY